MIIENEEYLAHYGILRKSGRYPWGSGETQEARNRTFLETVGNLHKQGLSDIEIARGFGMTTTELRGARSIAKAAEKQAQINMAQRLKDKGWSNVKIGERMGINESSVRALLAPGQKQKAEVLTSTSDMLKEQIAKKRYLDIGSGTERYLNISQTKLKTAVQNLQEEGYQVFNIKIDQLGTNHQTTLKVLAPPDSTFGEVYKNRDKIKSIATFSEDGGLTYSHIQPPISIDSKRVAVRYAEQGGTEADGVIYVRPGVEDISLGGANYAQVRVAVDGTHYLKGMAMYKDDLPPGVDLMFNTNKSDTGNKLDAMKPMKDDPENPFGSSVRQLNKLDEHGREIPDTVRSAMNIVNSEGDWEKWSNTLSSQFLSKQSRALAESQLGKAFESKQNELAKILSYTNPDIRKTLLVSYADDADSAAVHLKAASLPRQGTHIILPIESMRPDQVYAPNFRHGERVVLVRHPHGGIFEIPELTVNNRQPEAVKLLGHARDAVGIHSSVAEKLSGADFDGDTVLVIPNNEGKVKTAPVLEGLKGFDPRRRYPAYEGMPRMTPEQKGMEMGKISNLITDMTVKGAPLREIARAVRHSMVVIDAEKHNLNYKQSAIDNGIPELMKRYQGKAQGGAATLISRASSDQRVLERKVHIDKATGKKVYEYTGNTYEKTTVSPRTGKVTVKEVPKYDREKSTKLAEVEDANELSSGTRIESIYAEHSNRMKNLANQARKAAVNTKSNPYSPSAKKVYANEVDSLNAKLNEALRNSPLERQAQVIANAIVKQKQDATPGMDKAELKKLKYQELLKARIRTGAKKQLIEITDKEWEAIQAGAITANKLNQILSNTDLERVKELATPKAQRLLDEAKVSRAVSMLRNGYTRAQVADALGVSVSTLKRSIAGGE